jgi:hypothetical protein
MLGCRPAYTGYEAPNLPVRIVFGKTVTDVLRAETLRGAGKLRMSPHPTATVHDLR